MTRELLSFGCYLVFIIAGIFAIWSIWHSIKNAPICICGKNECGGGCWNKGKR